MSCYTSRANDCMGQNTIRILVIGKSGVGKTLLIQRLCREIFGPFPNKDDEELLKTRLKPTIGFAVDALMRDAWVNENTSQQPYDPGVMHASGHTLAHGLSARTAQARRMSAAMSPECAIMGGGAGVAQGQTSQRAQRTLRPQMVEFYEVGGTRSFGEAHRLPLLLIPYDGIMYVYNRCDPTSTDYLAVWYRRLTELFQSVSSTGAGGAVPGANADGGDGAGRVKGHAPVTSGGHHTLLHPMAAAHHYHLKQHPNGNAAATNQTNDTHGNTVNIQSMFPHYNEDGFSTTAPVRYRRKPKIILVGTQLRPSLPRKLSGWWWYGSRRGSTSNGSGGCCVVHSAVAWPTRRRGGGCGSATSCETARTYVPDEIAMIASVNRPVVWEEHNEPDGQDSAPVSSSSIHASSPHNRYSSESGTSSSFRHSMSSSSGGDARGEGGGGVAAGGGGGRVHSPFLVSEGRYENAMSTMAATACEGGRVWRCVLFAPRLVMRTVRLTLFFVSVLMHPSALLAQIHHEEQGCSRGQRGTMRVAERVAACAVAAGRMFVYGMNLVLFGPGKTAMPLHPPTVASTLLTIRQDDDCIAQLHKCCLYDRLALENSLDELLSSFDLLLSEKIASQR